MIRLYGIADSAPREDILGDYEKGLYFSLTDPSEMADACGMKKKPLSIQEIRKIDAIEKAIQGKDCSVCGAPNCRTFAEDVVRGHSSIEECIIFRAKGLGEKDIKT
jgi:ArsR family metal-binding transcriptional regulator